MRTIETFKDGTELVLFTAYEKFTGYGHYQISVDMVYRGKKKTFRDTTTNMEAIDAAKKTAVESWEDAKMILFETIQYQIEEEVLNWMIDVDMMYTEMQEMPDEIKVGELTWKLVPGNKKGMGHIKGSDGLEYWILLGESKEDFIKRVESYMKRSL